MDILWRVENVDISFWGKPSPTVWVAALNQDATFPGSYRERVAKEQDGVSPRGPDSCPGRLCWVVNWLRHWTVEIAGAAGASVLRVHSWSWSESVRSPVSSDPGLEFGHCLWIAAQFSGARSVWWNKTVELYATKSNNQRPGQDIYNAM